VDFPLTERLGDLLNYGVVSGRLTESEALRVAQSTALRDVPHRASRRDEQEAEATC
jgi:hypothetical protein